MAKRIKNNLADVPEHKMVIARWRLWCLQQLWAVDRAMADKPRGERMQRIVAEINRRSPLVKVGASKLYRWELAHRRNGLAGLVDARRGHPTAVWVLGARYRRELDRVPLPDLLDRTGELLAIVAERLRKGST